jgi:uncharacterized membrane protein (UPF0127 family)
MDHELTSEDIENSRPVKSAAEKDYAPGLPDPMILGDPSELEVGSIVPYVEQAHEGLRSGKHTDVRLGTDRMLSWATRKALPRPGDKRVTLFQQPAHRPEYRHFQGSIPLGTYGAGVVRQTDLGEAVILEAKPDKIKFVIGHRKRPEEFTMVRLGAKSGKPAWFLFNTTTTVPIEQEKIRYRKLPASQVDKLFNKDYVVAEKIDGAAAYLRLMKDHVEALSYRTDVEGRPIIHTHRLGVAGQKFDIPKHLRGKIFRGEIYGEHKGQAIPAAELGGLLNAAVTKSLRKQKEKGIKLHMALFGVLDGYKIPVDERRRMIREVLDILPKEKFGEPEYAETPQAARRLWKRIITGRHPRTREGIVAFPRAGGVPTKVKPFREADVYIRKIFEGEKRLAGRAAGGFQYSLTPRGPVVGRVGTGLDEEERERMWREPGEYVGRVARIKVQEQFPSGAYRAPVYIARHESPRKAAGIDVDVLMGKASKRTSKRESGRVATGGGKVSDVCKRLMKDIVIPAGTVFEEAPRKTERFGKGHVDHILGLTDDTHGTLTYFVDEDDPEIGKWFVDVKEKAAKWGRALIQKLAENGGTNGTGGNNGNGADTPGEVTKIRSALHLSGSARKCPRREGESYREWKHRCATTVQESPPGPGKVAAMTESIARDLNRARKQTDTNPSEAQIEAGNYRKGKLQVHGLTISIENPKGSTRSGTDADGKKWSVTMATDYGYFGKGSKGADGEQVDVFIGPKPELEHAFVVDQMDPKTKKFDETKVLLGYTNQHDAKQGYLRNYEKGWQGCGKITRMSIDELKNWLENGKPTEPAAEYTKEGVVSAGYDTKTGVDSHWLDKVGTFSNESDTKSGAFSLQPSTRFESQPTCTLELTSPNGEVRGSIRAEMATTPVSRTLGLSKRAELPGDTGMFFDTPGPFWMKNVRFPLDIVFLSKEGEVQDTRTMPVVKAGERPVSYASASPRTVHALELPAGWCARNGVVAGDRVVYVKSAVTTHEAPAKQLLERKRTKAEKKYAPRTGLEPSTRTPTEVRAPILKLSEKGIEWVGIDLDGTLARYDGFKGKDVVGEPIPDMVNRVKRWLADGHTVKIMTARVADDPGGKAEKAIKAWCREHLGKELEVTNEKDCHMTKLWDDRAVQVEKNTGKKVAAIEREKTKTLPIPENWEMIEEHTGTGSDNWKVWSGGNDWEVSATYNAIETLTPYRGSQPNRVIWYRTDFSSIIGDDYVGDKIGNEENQKKLRAWGERGHNKWLKLIKEQKKRWRDSLGKDTTPEGPSTINDIAVWALKSKEMEPYVAEWGVDTFDAKRVKDEYEIHDKQAAFDPRMLKYLLLGTGVLGSAALARHLQSKVEQAGGRTRTMGAPSVYTGAGLDPDFPTYAIPGYGGLAFVRPGAARSFARRMHRTGVLPEGEAKRIAARGMLVYDPELGGRNVFGRGPFTGRKFMGGPGRGTAQMASMLSMFPGLMAGYATGSPVVGGLAGLASGAAVTAPTWLHELQASNLAREYIRSDVRKQRDKGLMGKAYLSYLLPAMVLPGLWGAGAGLYRKMRR